MNRYFISIVAISIFTGISTLKSQIYTPSGTIQGSSGSDNVGIGTPTPAEKLHINGSIRGDQSGALRINSGNGYIDVGCKNIQFAHFYTDRTQYYFDKKILLGEGIITSYGYTDLNLCTSSSYTSRIYVKNDNGNVGIGTTTPSAKLHVNAGTTQGMYIQTGNEGPWALIIKNNTAPNNGLQIFQGNNGFSHIWNNYPNGTSITLSNNGNVGIGTSAPQSKLSLGDVNNIANRIAVYEGTTSTPGQYFYGIGMANPATGVYGLGLYGGTGTNLPSNTNMHVYINNNGNVGIGTCSPDYKLDVLGTIRATEIKVETGWADYVFEKDYSLRSLSEVESYIKDNGHLPEIPSANEIEEGGLKLGEMNALLMKKIEELTLYVIEQNKQISDLKKSVERLENK